MVQIGMGSPSRRAALSLLEVVVAACIAVIAMVPLLVAMMKGKDADLLSEHTARAMLLADSVLEQARARITSAIRPQPGSDGRVTIDAWRTVFNQLAESRKKVVSPNAAEVSSYFQRIDDPRGGAAGPVQEGVDPLTFSQLAGMEVEVQVHFDVNGAQIDSDGDRRAESDMCELVVVVHWNEPQLGPRSYQLNAVLTSDLREEAN
jgi:hypothetical protein